MEFPEQISDHEKEYWRKLSRKICGSPVYYIREGAWGFEISLSNEFKNNQPVYILYVTNWLVRHLKQEVSLWYCDIDGDWNLSPNIYTGFITSCGEEKRFPKFTLFSQSGNDKLNRYFSELKYKLQFFSTSLLDKGERDWIAYLIFLFKKFDVPIEIIFHISSFFRGYDRYARLEEDFGLWD